MAAASLPWRSAPARLAETAGSAVGSRCFEHKVSVPCSESNVQKDGSGWGRKVAAGWASDFYMTGRCLRARTECNALQANDWRLRTCDQGLRTAQRRGQRQQAAAMDTETPPKAQAMPAAAITAPTTAALSSPRHPPAPLAAGLHADGVGVRRRRLRRLRRAGWRRLLRGCAYNSSLAPWLLHGTPAKEDPLAPRHSRKRGSPCSTALPRKRIPLLHGTPAKSLGTPFVGQAIPAPLEVSFLD
eukprot:gene12950-biopygen5671